MSTIEYIAIIALLLSIILLIKVYSLQSLLNDLKSDVERLENRSGISGIHGTSLSGTFTTTPIHNLDTGASEDINERLLLLIREGKKIQAIKELRTAKDLSLKDAKDYVDHLEKL
ncbi:ribosomal protein L7/L12 [Paenibacillus polymyxa]|uniref:ribosomal protein L7/L12 n=1 Tax=Paenibacillus polymyxa TaxID=1406 RepID=UPI002AB54055|nr:ribosomal protein L7/L12 [Paenibacillus polymyxa]MDY8023455.1 ribosomal protein L7/L12 [Paenibacillus polymyxa]